MDFTYLPDELILPILIDLPIQDLIHFCQVDKRIQNLCQDERLWQERVRKDYNYAYGKKHRNLSWQQFYVQLANNQIRSVNVYYQDKLIGEIQVSYFDTIHQVRRSLILLLRGIIDPRIINVGALIRAPRQKDINMNQYDVNTQIGTIGYVQLPKLSIDTYDLPEELDLNEERYLNEVMADYTNYMNTEMYYGSSQNLLWNNDFHFVIERYTLAGQELNYPHLNIVRPR